MKKYLLDANALIMLIKKANLQNTIECLNESSILDLTFYEIGNGIWKETALTKTPTINNAENIGKFVQLVLEKIDQITVETQAFQGILEIAKNEMLTFYDSSYIYFAKEKQLILVTEDKELKRKAHKYVKTKVTAELLP